MNDTPARTSSLERKLAGARFFVTHFSTRLVRDPGGGLVTVGKAMVEIDELRAQIGRDRRLGSYRHNKITSLQRFLVGSLPLIDGAVLFWFLLGVLNVDLRRLDALMIVAAVLAVLGTVAVAAWNTAVGRRLQVAKNDAGGIIWEAVDGVERIMLGISAVVALLVGAMMDVRVADEVYQATGVADATSVIVGVTLGASIVVLNLYVLHLAFADGSNITRRADALERCLRSPVRRFERNLARVDRLEEQIRLVRANSAVESPALPG